MFESGFFARINEVCFRNLWFFLLFLPFFGLGQALSGNYIIGASQPAPFNTITNAVARINSSGVSGPVTFLLDDAIYSASESFPITINAFAGASAVNTLTIKPNTGKTVLIRANNSGATEVASVIDLNGADYVVFDGNNGSVNKALTVYNNSTVHTSPKTVFWLRNTASFNQVRNLNIQQNFSAVSDFSLGIFAGGSSISTASNANNPNTTVNNVNFVDVKHLLYVNGIDETGNANWTVSNTTNTTTNAVNKPFAGIVLTKTSNFIIANNILSNLSETNLAYGNFPFAGGIVVTANNGIISNNQVSDVISSIAKTAFGIYITGNNITLANNVVSNVASIGGGGTATQNGFGIILDGANNTKIYYNSVRLGVNQTSGISAPIYIESNCNALDIRNNIFINAQTSGSTRVAFYSAGMDTSKFLNLDYNNYVSAQHIGSWGDYYTPSNLKTTLANWKSATAKEANAKNITPDFVSNTTLRLQQTLNNESLQGIALAAVVTDIDGENRVKPYMGADEFTCTLPPTTSFGATQSICYNREVASPNIGGVTFSSVPFNRYVTLNVIQGLQYRIATTATNIGLIKKITLYNNATPAVALSNFSASSTTTSASLDWTASFTGVLRIEFTPTICQSSANTDTLTATFIGGNNTIDNPNAAGTNSWVGHVYDFSNAVGVPPTDANAFANYLGNFTQANTVSGTTRSFVQGYGGTDTCFPFTASGTSQTVRTDTFAVRYKMQTTSAVYPAGCYFVNVRGDDGVRLYIDGVLVFNAWEQQGPSNFRNVLVSLTGNSLLEFDFYEKGGENVSDFTIFPVDAATLSTINAITPAGTTIRCVNTNTLLTGSGVATQDNSNNKIPPVSFQWQSSTDNVNWTDIASATGKDYIVPGTNPVTATQVYYRRNLKGTTVNSSGCVYSSNVVTIITGTTGTPTAPTYTPGTEVTCSSFKANWNTVSSATSYRLDVSTGSGFTSFVSGYSNLNVGFVTSFNVTGLGIGTYYYRVRAVGCNGSTSANVNTPLGYQTVVLDSPGTPAVGTITNVTCSSAGSVVLNNLPSGSWTINQIGTSTAAYSGSGTSYTVTGLTAGNYTFTVTRGCTSLPTINVPIINSSSTTWNGSSWSNGIPDATKNAIVSTVVPNSPFTSNLTACALTISSGVIATVPTGVTLTITNAVTTNGQLIFENNASLVQTTNATNTGAIEYRRKSSPMKNFDFTYWASPVSGQTAKLLSPNTLWDKYFRFSGSANDWVFDDGEMKPGVGFIIRTPKPGIYGAPYPETVVMPYAQPVAFKGVPNNGNYSFIAGANQMNLLGNPYPSAIDADKFIIDNVNIIDGALYFWTHNTAIAQSGSDYVYTADDYASYTLTGGTGTGVGNFVDANGNGVMDPNEEMVSNKPLGKIAAGQSFFVESKAIPTATQFVFNNNMRVAGNNSQFFKQVTNTKKTTTIEKNRIWLNLTNSGGAFKQLLVGYITGATNDWDNLYDGLTFDGQEFVDFYSVNQGKNLTVQGRALPFSEKDEVPLGYRSTIAGTFNISIDNRDGALAGQAIWLEDKKTNTMHDLTKGKYTFIAIDGVENDRFVLKYTNKTLGTDDNEPVDKALIVSVKNKKITVTSSAEAITQVQVFDLLGRKVYDKSKINTQEWTLSNLSLSNQILIVKTTLANGAISNKKIIY
ncbi:T9SS sorting signal type C domain-containing protein [Flavobacterium sp.]|uniref:T9SS sorting signal type C domain-containing protein n=1 Tax=Flavobacterium sp. TaxID=239 RepID=UPI0022BC074E|nr:T9SS sorting signal type C domain-containing protein [Flavobacterium sp.]MCZ8228926.1 T9SS sorting signal type C domain-containing protein [Flavobacterium sp.]